jgi:hypothetical protein
MGQGAKNNSDQGQKQNVRDTASLEQGSKEERKEKNHADA